MQIGINKLLLTILLIIIIYLIAVIYLSRKRQSYLGIILPGFFACVAVYNYLKPILVPNPRPTMKEAMFMIFFGTLSILGFIVFLVVKYIYRGNRT